MYVCIYTYTYTYTCEFHYILIPGIYTRFYPKSQINAKSSGHAPSIVGEAANKHNNQSNFGFCPGKHTNRQAHAIANLARKWPKCNPKVEGKVACTAYSTLWNPCAEISEDLQSILGHAGNKRNKNRHSQSNSGLAVLKLIGRVRICVALICAMPKMDRVCPEFLR